MEEGSIMALRAAGHGIAVGEDICWNLFLRGGIAHRRPESRRYDNHIEGRDKPSRKKSAARHCRASRVATAHGKQVKCDLNSMRARRPALGNENEKKSGASGFSRPMRDAERTFPQPRVSAGLGTRGRPLAWLNADGHWLSGGAELRSRRTSSAPSAERLKPKKSKGGQDQPPFFELKPRIPYPVRALSRSTTASVQAS
jgi:hypothetical protein